MSHLGATEAVVAFFLLVALMGAWDGLMRRHIRSDIDVIQVHMNLRGSAAVGLGALSLLLAALLGRLIIQYTSSVAIDCRLRMPCILQRVLLPPFAAWPSACAVLLAVVLFAYWASDAWDLGGPYRRHLLAPRVWDTDKEPLARVASQLHAKDLPPVNDDTVVEMASWVRQSLMLFRGAARAAMTRDGHLDANSLTYVLLSTRAVRKFKLSKHVLPVVLAAIAEYYEEKYDQAARIWPWRRKVFPY